MLEEKVKSESVHVCLMKSYTYYIGTKNIISLLNSEVGYKNIQYVCISLI